MGVIAQHDFSPVVINADDEPGILAQFDRAEEEVGFDRSAVAFIDDPVIMLGEPAVILRDGEGIIDAPIECFHTIVAIDFPYGTVFKFKGILVVVQDSDSSEPVVGV